MLQQKPHIREYMKISNKLERIDDELYLKNVKFNGYDVRGGLILGSDKAVILRVFKILCQVNLNFQHAV